MSTLFGVIILGFVQGLTEFLPVSSTAHLVLFQRWLGIDTTQFGLTFDMITALGTLVALLIVFWPRIIEMYHPSTLLKPTKPIHRFARVALVATVFVAGVGALLEDFIEGPLRNVWIIAAALIVGSIYMIVAEKITTSRPSRTATPLGVFATGIAQILAFIPGFSRSGATISTGLLSGMSHEDATNLSFLLSVPIITLAVAKKLFEVVSGAIAGTIPTQLLGYYAIGGVVAGLVGWISLRWMIAIVSKKGLLWFVPYRLSFAAVIILVELFR